MWSLTFHLMKKSMKNAYPGRYRHYDWDGHSWPVHLLAIRFQDAVVRHDTAGFAACKSILLTILY